MSRRIALSIVLAALVGRLALLAAVYSRSPSAFQTLDSRDYLGCARALLSLGVYAPDPERAGEADIVRTPGYPVLLAGTLAIAGERPWALSVVGALLATGTALVMLFGLGKLFGDRTAAWAAVLLSLDLGSFGRSLDVHSESEFTLLLALALWALGVSVARSSLRLLPFFLAGLFVALAVLVRPILFYFPFALTPLLLVIAGRRAAGLRRSLFAAASFLLPVILLVGGWIIRNGLRTGAFVLTPVAGHQLLHRRAASVLAQATGKPLSQVQEELGIREAFYRWRGPSSEADLFGPKRYAELFPETSRLTAPQLERIWTRKALRIFREHPVGTIRMLAEGTALLLFSPPPVILSARWGLIRPAPELGQLFADQDIPGLARGLLHDWPVLFFVSAASALLLLALYVLAVRGSVLLWRSVPPEVHVVLAATLLYLIAVSASTDAIDDRFRIPLMPIVCLYAGGALARERSRALSPA